MRKIRVNALVRQLLEGQADLFDKVTDLTARLADCPPVIEAMAIGEERESVYVQLRGVAWRIHCAATGKVV